MSKLFDELKTMRSSYEKKLQKEGETALKEAFKEVFDKFPSIASISWRQYTPYFNDGDACHFGVYDFYLTTVKPVAPEDAVVSPDEEDDDDYDDDDYDSGVCYLRHSKDPVVKEMAQAVYVLSQELPDDVLESVFGDHCRIVATREGFKVSEFDHD